MPPGPVEFMLEASSHLLHQQAGLDLSERYYMDPLYRLDQDKQAAAWAQQRFPGFQVYVESGEFEAAAPPAIRVGGLQPYLIVCALFGAELRFWDDHEPAVAAEPLKDVADPFAITAPDIEENPLVRRLVAQVRDMQRRYGDEMAINPPFFWDDSGWAFVHAPFTTAYKLRGERFFTELISDPPAAQHLINVAAQTTALLVDLFARVGGRQVTGIHLGDCAASLVSARHYGRFAAPALEQMAARYGPARLHSCGPSTHLLPVLAQIQGIQEFQLGWDTDLAAARAWLGSRPIAYLLPPAFLAQRPAQIESQMRAGFDANGDAPLTWWLSVDHGTPQAHLELVHRIWLERSPAL